VDSRTTNARLIRTPRLSLSKAITNAEVVAFPELGMEAIYEFEVVDMPVTVAVDTEGQSVHQSGPALWKSKIQEMPLNFKK
jgi:fumarate hydratase class I